MLLKIYLTLVIKYILFKLPELFAFWLSILAFVIAIIQQQLGTMRRGLTRFVYRTIFFIFAA